MDAKKNSQSLMLGVPGLLLQFGSVFASPVFGEDSMIPFLILLTGTGLLIAGLAYYAMAKGHSALWCLMGFLSIIGLVVLAVLPDRAVER